MWFKKREDKKNHDSRRIHMMNRNRSDDYHDYDDFDEDNFEEDDYHEYINENISKVDEEDILTLLENEEKIIKKLRHATPLKKFFEVGKLMCAMIRDFITGRFPETPWLTIATSVIVLLYVLNPFDFIPDFIPFIGYLDDLVIMTIGLGWIETDLHKYLNWRIEDAVSQLGE